MAIDEALKTMMYKTGSKVKTTCICPFYISTGMFDGAKKNLVFNILEPDWVVWRSIVAI